MTTYHPIAARCCGRRDYCPHQSADRQMAMPASIQNSAPELADFAPFEKMRGEYESMAIYPNGHLMEFIRPNLPRNILACAAAEAAPDDKTVRVAGGPIARQHIKGRGGAVFITIEDDTSDTQLFVRLDYMSAAVPPPRVRRAGRRDKRTSAAVGWRVRD